MATLLSLCVVFGVAMTGAKIWDGVGDLVGSEWQLDCCLMSILTFWIAVVSLASLRETILILVCSSASWWGGELVFIDCRVDFLCWNSSSFFCKKTRTCWLILKFNSCSCSFGVVNCWIILAMFVTNRFAEVIDCWNSCCWSSGDMLWRWTKIALFSCILMRKDCKAPRIWLLCIIPIDRSVRLGCNSKRLDGWVEFEEVDSRYWMMDSWSILSWLVIDGSCIVQVCRLVVLGG